MSFFNKFISLFKGRTYFINGSGTRSKPRNRMLEQSEIVSAIVDCNAAHVAKGQIMHVRKDSEGRVIQILRASNYTKLFEHPNRMMSRQDFLYALTWQLQMTNTAFAWIKWDAAMHPVEIWPLVYLNFEVRETQNGETAVFIQDNDGTYTVLLEDLVVLRRKYDGTGISGQSNSVITNTLEMVDSLDEGLKQAVDISNKIHGIIHQKNSMLAPDSVEDQQHKFIQRMDKAAKEGGIVALDSSEEYTPLNVSAWSANAAQSKQITDRVYTYWRTPEEVVRNIATEQVMQNYYDSIVEPIWEEMSEAFTRALFTRTEENYGNRLIVYSGAATGASWQTKLNIIAQTKEIGALSRNEQRELLGYGPVEDGDEHYVSLNYIKSSDMSKYQTGDEGTTPQPAPQPADSDDGGDNNDETEEDKDE